jgi:GNAT superfamily N-acetyltransferase
VRPVPLPSAARLGSAWELRPASYDEPDVARLTARVQEYYREIYGGTDDSPMDRDEFVPPHGLFLVGRLVGEAVAMGGWRFITGVEALGGRRLAEIRRMYVAADVRRRGVAGLLLAELERTAAAAGADVMVLATGQPQPDAVSFYRRHGYVDVPGFGHYAGMAESVHLGKHLPIGKS